MNIRSILQEKVDKEWKTIDIIKRLRGRGRNLNEKKSKFIDRELKHIERSLTEARTQLKAEEENCNVAQKSIDARNDSRDENVKNLSTLTESLTNQVKNKDSNEQTTFENGLAAKGKALDKTN